MLLIRDWKDILVVIGIILLPILSYKWIRKSATTDNNKFIYKLNNVCLFISEALALIFIFTPFHRIANKKEAPYSMYDMADVVVSSAEMLKNIQLLLSQIAIYVIVFYILFAVVYAVYVKQKYKKN